ncbi:MAG: tetratricopeptide repeat protein [Calditrichaeota bacterium]|nr:MAG: tetratricopeptide repeat protein [Calditrichota bacterium]
MGRYQEAVSEFQRAIQIDPYLMPSYNGLVLLYLYQLGEPDSALFWTKKQISYNPNDFWAYDHLGWAYLGLDSLRQAEQAFKRALEINPKSTLELYRLAHTYRLQGRYQEGLQPIQKILEINPKETWAYYHLGILYQLLGNKKEAHKNFYTFLKEAEKWVQQEPTNGENYIALGLAKARLGEVKQARKIAAKADQMESTSHFGYAQLLSVLDEKEAALDELEKQVEQGYRNYIWIKIHPDLQPLYNHPRFKALIAHGLKTKIIESQITGKSQ